MEEQTLEWKKDLVIVRDGRFFKVRNGTVYVGGAFTTVQHAENFIKGYNNKRVDDIVRKETKKIKNSDKPIKQRMKEYKELCQAIPDYS
jgi:viroplasmin and RNaseH domain-containing protein